MPQMLQNYLKAGFDLIHLDLFLEENFKPNYARVIFVEEIHMIYTSCIFYIL